MDERAKPRPLLKMPYTRPGWCRHRGAVIDSTGWHCPACGARLLARAENRHDD